VENQAKTCQNQRKKQHLTILMYFDAISRLSLFWNFWILEILVLQLRILRDELLPFFLQQWKQKCRSSELKDASLRRTFSNCNEMYALRHLLSTFGYWDRTLQCQVYPYGSYNCCRRPKGICRIRPGKASCCSWRHRPLQLGSQSEFLSFNEKLICGGSPT
jgi:hypothetical protein